MELIFLSNTSIKHLDEHGPGLFAKLREVIMNSATIMRLFAAAAPQAFSADLMDEPAGTSRGTSSDIEILGSSRVFYGDLMRILLQKYIKIRQADALKAIFRKRKVEAEALRRRLKSSCATTSTEDKDAKKRKKADQDAESAKNAAEKDAKRIKKADALLEAAWDRMKELKPPSVKGAGLTQPMLTFLLSWGNAPDVPRKENESSSDWKRRMEEVAQSSLEIRTIAAAAVSLQTSSLNEDSDSKDSQGNEQSKFGDEEGISLSNGSGGEESRVVGQAASSDIASDTASDSSD